MTANLAIILGLFLGAAGILAAAFFYGSRLGKEGQQNRDLKSLSDLQREQAKAQANAPKDKTGLLARLRGKGL